MNCDLVESGDFVERYLRRELSEAEQEAFERHFFDCRRCLEALESCSAVRAGLAESAGAITAEPQAGVMPGWLVASALAAAAAVVFLAAWVWRAGPGETIRPGAAPTNVGSRAADPSSPPSADRSRVETLARLARVEPPAYVPLKMRNAADEASRRFDEAMGEYARREYAPAAEHLREASRLDPASRITFFLGICSLMIDRPDAAIASFHQTLASGDSAFEEEAHFHLAKAYLRKAMLEPAREELNATVALGGPRSDEARRLLLDIEPLLRR